MTTTTTADRYLGTIDVPAYPDADGGYVAGAVRTLGYLGAGGAILGDGDRLKALRFPTGRAARAAVAAAHPTAIPGTSRLRAAEVTR